MPFANFATSRDDTNLVVVIAVGTVGSLLGVAPWCQAGRVLGRERLARWADRHGEWLTLSASEVNGASE
jgi:membrane protein DedA with SNARE-associated domain